MSYWLISKTEPKARRDYRCIWCPELIGQGEVHIHEFSTYCGDPQDNRWHPECWKAAQEYFRKSGESEFPPHESKRGSLEQALP